jgi:acetyl esterase/lipase
VAGVEAGAEDRALLCMHGGDFAGGSIYSHRSFFGHMAKDAGVRALVFDYRLTSEHNHPAQVDDATTAYRWLIEQRIDTDRSRSPVIPPVAV